MLLVLELSRRRERTRGVEASDSKANEVNGRTQNTVERENRTAHAAKGQVFFPNLNLWR